MRNSVFVVVWLAVTVCGCGAAEDSGEPAAKPSGPCAAYGEAPKVTTIRTPVSAEQPHPDCIAQSELSPAGQRVYCCMGAAFDAWYSNLK
jgi:hypothetical protein